jgi:hypothetical protein
MIPASERAKEVHALDRSATVTGLVHEYFLYIMNNLYLNGTSLFMTCRIIASSGFLLCLLSGTVLT